MGLFDEFGDGGFESLFETGKQRAERLANNLRKAAQQHAPAQAQLEMEDRLERLVRKSQWLIDRAYNKALQDMVQNNPTEANREAAHRLRRPERHRDEFAKGSTDGNKG